MSLKHLIPSLRHFPFFASIPSAAGR
ncbi:uncharacterized protein FFC1_10014 [Fusarium fujikuroi]|nr:uncharacterized protein FFC1_10014 [Fusarium fujikuroi]